MRPRAGLMLFLGAVVVAAMLGGSVMRRQQTGLGAYGRVLAAARLAPAPDRRPGSDCLMRMVLLRQRDREANSRKTERERGCASEREGLSRACAFGQWPAPGGGQSL
ncbi:MAG: hypothetical protein AAGU21_13375 [Solidesulfovibrio sp.]|uniref:hypothetical protein n=1 Tax=Solidesulfovibrio sp. TaxID=2910990 RepID=UPI002B21E8FD|nr:hypothetical protein [Solidesulfovibrio sp.]